MQALSLESSSATNNQQRNVAASDHGFALVPLGAGYHQSPDVLARGRSVDTGLLAESLIYYDRVLITVDNPVRFADLISLLVQQGLPASDIIALFSDGTIQVLNFAFTTNPYVEFRESGLHIHGLYNVQDQQMLKANSFVERFLGFEPLKGCFADNSQFVDFCRTLDGRVIEVKADEIGAAAIDNAWLDFLNPERNELMAQQLVNEIYRLKRLGKAPRVKVTISSEEDGTHQVQWNIRMDQLPALDAEVTIKAAASLPLSTAAEANKYLWASETQGCDLYLTSPVSVAVGDKLFEASNIEVNSTTKVRSVIESLEASVEFPNLRRYINEDRIDFDRIMEIRRKGKKFRAWLQTEAERDRDAIIAYHNEVAKESGFIGVGRRALKLFGFVSGGVLGAAIGHDLGVGAIGGIAGHVAQKGVEKGVNYLFNLGAHLGVDWKPVCFGNWYKERIERLLDRER
jgi:hypothetical protein